MDEYLYITKSRMPDEKLFLRQCVDICESSRFTNNGRYVRKLERSLGDYLGINHILACNNGTTALMLALQCAGLAGKKVALTPYTYVATLSALLWLGCEPVFVDIDPDSLCLSPELLRQRLRKEPDIAGVLPVHIYGMACDVESLEAICREHGAVLIYDAAQAFGSRYKGKSLLDYGDYSVCSFHATKIFHTAEGGCVVSRDAKTYEALSLARAFGHINDEHHRPGINGKMSELHAALGLALLDGTNEEIERRKRLYAAYGEALADLNPVRPVALEGLEWNHAYYPVLLPNEESRARVEQASAARKIRLRRYFYPALNTLPYLNPAWRTPCPAAEDAARRVLCLPMYGELEQKDIERVSLSLRANPGDADKKSACSGIERRKETM